MKITDTVIIGGGQAGLAMSRCLAERSIDHVILERGKLGQRWRDERWDSLRLLSPNWMARLPHYAYAGDDPDGFMTMPEFTHYLEEYAVSFNAPLMDRTTVKRVERVGTDQLLVVTNRGSWQARNLVIATGFCDRPRIPAFADALSPDIYQFAPSDYRRPSQLPAGNVLVVGASSTGAQIADELSWTGRDVTLAVGTHIRLPRRYRGRDILGWMVDMGAFRASSHPDDERLSPPPQLVGRPDNRDLDLRYLQSLGVRLTGRAKGAEARRVSFADDLNESIAKADTQLFGLLEKIDGYIESNGISAVPAEEVMPVPCPKTPSEIDLDDAGITSIIWATGYRRSYPWLKLPVLDKRGEIGHVRGITSEPGVVVLGMRFQMTKGSNLIDGVGADAELLADHLAARRLQLAAA